MKARTKKINTLPQTSPAVTTGLLQRKCESCGTHTVAGGECKDCENKKGMLQRKSANNSTGFEVPPVVHEVLNSPGRPLDADIRSFFEPRFNHDFSGVRVHTDAKAAESASSVNALAYTVGRDVVFGSGQYSPGTTSGRSLLAHELTHTLQQSGAEHGSASLTMGAANSASEREADQVAQAVSHESKHYPVRNSSLTKMQKAPSRSLTAPEAKKDNDVDVEALSEDLTRLIAEAVWVDIVNRMYDDEKAAGIERAKKRHADPKLDLTGLGQIKTLDHFAKEIHNLQSNWATLSSSKKVTEELKRITTVELESADVPRFLVVNQEAMEGTEVGRFTGKFWKFTINEKLLSEDVLTDEYAAELANTTLHESRHAEQAFLAARYSAGLGMSSDEIASQHQIPKPIAEEGVSKKFNDTTAKPIAALGEQMFTSSVVNREKYRRLDENRADDKLSKKRGLAKRALKRLKQSPTKEHIADAILRRDELKTEIGIVEKNNSRFLIPYEEDAYEVGDAAEAAFTGWE